LEDKLKDKKSFSNKKANNSRKRVSKVKKSQKTK